MDEKTIEKISNFYCYAMLGFFIKYLWANMEGDIDENVDELYRIFNGSMAYIVQKAEKGSTE